MSEKNISLEKEKVERHIHTIKGLIHYHDYMNMSGTPCESAECKHREQIGKCPTVAFNDIYREALVKSLDLLQAEYDRL